MHKYKYIILGAGPAGLTIGNCLKQEGENDFLILECEDEPGGLCRSTEVDNAPLDIGGGHFLDIKRPQVTNFLFGFMPEDEWNLFDRDSRIQIGNHQIDHPMEANIWQLPLEEQVRYLKSISEAGCNRGTEPPEEFTQWIYWKLGDAIAEDYMMPYNQKMFGNELDKLGTYWLEKLPNVSFEETLLSCLSKKAYGKQPGHERFFYPKQYGYGEVWKRMGKALGEHIKYSTKASSLDFNSMVVSTSKGNKYWGKYIITTVPWMSFDSFVGMPRKIEESIKSLKYTSIEIKYFSENLDTKAHWIYYPSQELDYHRILVRHNFCLGSKGGWTETNLDRVCDSDVDTSFRHINKYAYPLNTIEKPFVMKQLLNWAKTKGVIGVGRWGEHQHYNSDVTVELAMDMVKNLLCENTMYY